MFLGFPREFICFWEFSIHQEHFSILIPVEEYFRFVLSEVLDIVRKIKTGNPLVFAATILRCEGKIGGFVFCAFIRLLGINF